VVAPWGDVVASWGMWWLHGGIEHLAIDVKVLGSIPGISYPRLEPLAVSCNPSNKEGPETVSFPQFADLGTAMAALVDCGVKIVEGTRRHLPNINCEDTRQQNGGRQMARDGRGHGSHGPPARQPQMHGGGRGRWWSE
jgi:hypothetical protein